MLGVGRVGKDFSERGIFISYWADGTDFVQSQCASPTAPTLASPPVLGLTSSCICSTSLRSIPGLLKKLSSQQTSSVALPHLTPRRVAAEFRLLCAPEASASLAAPDAQRPRVDADRLSTRGRHTLPSAQLPGGFGHACSG